MMNRADATTIFNVDPSASREEMRDAYQELFNEHRLRLDNAPTSTLRNLYSDQLRVLEEAREVLLGPPMPEGTSDLPSNRPFFPGQSASVPGGPGAIPIQLVPTAQNKPSVQRIWLRAIIGVVSVLIVGVAMLYVLKPKAGDVAPRSSRLQLALVAKDPANQVGPSLHMYGDSSKTYGIERDLTLPGDFEAVSAATDEAGRAELDIRLSPAAVRRINSESILDRDIALVMDGRTVLSAARVMAPFGTHARMNGNFSFDDINRLLDAMSVSASRNR